MNLHASLHINQRLGLFLFHSVELLQKIEFDIGIFVHVSKEACKHRRLKRDEWLRENESYFEKVIWPNYVKHNDELVLSKIEQDLKIQEITIPDLSPIYCLDGEQAFESVLQLSKELINEKRSL